MHSVPNNSELACLQHVYTRCMASASLPLRLVVLWGPTYTAELFTQQTPLEQSTEGTRLGGPT